MQGRSSRLRLSTEAWLAIELEANRRFGILPEGGGWLDQDSYYIRLINLATTIRDERTALEHKKLSRRKSKSGFWRK